MADDQAAATAVQPAVPRTDPTAVSSRFYRKHGLVEGYANLQLRPPERLLFESYAKELATDVLEVGCGGGRLIRPLLETASSVHGIDISEEMVEYCRDRYPAARFEVMDMREVAAHRAAPFGALIAGFNVVDALGPTDRRRALRGFHRVLVPGGLLIMSAHNRAVKPRGPIGDAVFRIQSGSVRRAARGIVHLPRRLANRHRLAGSQVEAAGYSIRNDSGHDYALLHHYISRDDQERQLALHGFELVECFDLQGDRVAPGEDAPHCSELHYVARRTDYVSDGVGEPGP